MKYYYQIILIIILVTEQIKGESLYQYIKGKKKLTEVESIEILLKLTIALQAVHNIKLENALIDKDNIKLIDFGFTEKILRDRLQNGQGTAGYIAPQIFVRQPYQEIGDVFKQIYIIFFIVSGRAPFRSNTYDGLLKLNQECQIDFSESRFLEISYKSICLLKAMLQEQPENRINIQDLLAQLQVYNLFSHSPNVVSTQSIIEGSLGISVNHLQSITLQNLFINKAKILQVKVQVNFQDICKNRSKEDLKVKVWIKKDNSQNSPDSNHHQSMFIITFFDFHLNFSKINKIKYQNLLYYIRWIWNQLSNQEN
ncbi:unnamed protein product [Paramecium octaurelia]|uniref:Protein kinase domain-containing protein n=1 Tax=Paramecium octaurelia TaxID=43137 RepID=A0A8S1WS10_PAROT|nr:unnamed protein product [Paramecium octaurelia]